MNKPSYDQSFWEELWTKTLRDHGDKVGHKSPNAHLVAEASRLAPGRALDAGSGHGAETLWLAAQGWRVTAVDFSATALARGRSIAEAMGPEIAERLVWTEGDLATFAVPPDCFELVLCLYVHVAEAVEDRVRRMASGVAVGGTLFMVGHQPTEAISATLTVKNQTQVSVAEAMAALEPQRWEWIVAEDRTRADGRGIDAVLCARRLS